MFYSNISARIMQLRRRRAEWGGLYPGIASQFAEKRVVRIRASASAVPKPELESYRL